MWFEIATVFMWMTVILDALVMADSGGPAAIAAQLLLGFGRVVAVCRVAGADVNGANSTW